MPVTAGTATTLAAALARSATTVRFAWDMAALCAQTATQHVVVTIYSAKHSEQVLVTGCETAGGVQYAQVQRGFNGTTPRDWPLDACACVASVMNACAGDDDDADNCCPDPLAGVVADGCIEIDRTNPAAPIIRLKATGVTPVDTPCIKVNGCGLVEHISPGFPGDCLPIFSPCAPCDAPSGGATSAQQVSFSAVGTAFATGPSVYSALTQLDAALQAVIAGGTGIAGVGAGAGIAITGTSTAPVVNLQTIHAGGGSTVAGLQYDAYGRVVAYSPPASPGIPSHTVTAPATISLSGLTYTHGVANATDTDFGAVKLANAAALTNSAADPTDVITASTFSAALDGQLYDITVGTGLTLTGGGDLTVSDQTIALDLTALPAVTAQAAGTMIPVLDGGTDHSLQLREDFTRDVGGAYAAGEFVGASGAPVAMRNASVTRTAAGQYTLAFSSPGGLPTNYVLNIHVTGTGLGAWHANYERVSATQALIRIHNSANALADPPRVAFAAFSID